MNGSASGPVIEVTGLTKRFGPITALNNVDLSVQAGELVALLGLNGAGKSTFLQILTGLFTPDSGRVAIYGRDLESQIVGALELIGVVFQQPTLDLELSVRANLQFHADLHGLPRSVSKARIKAALEQFGLTERARDPVRQLSGGNRRRVELARALLHHPRALIMDEATVGLDPASRREILEHILTIKGKEGLGVLWTTHLVDEAAVADRVVVLHKGQKLFDGPPQSLASRSPENNLSDAFLSLAGVNADSIV